MENCFYFRIIQSDNGIEVFDKSCITPYAALTPVQMQEYIEADNQIALMSRMKRKEQREILKKRRKMKWEKLKIKKTGLH